MAELDAILGNDEGGMDMGMGDTNQGAPRRNPAYEQLLTAWRSEQACPEVLPWRGDLVDALLDAAEQQEAMVKATVEQGGDVDECLFSAPLYESELARCRFVVGSYVRCRLRKLERQCGYIIADDDAYGGCPTRRRACRQVLGFDRKAPPRVVTRRSTRNPSATSARTATSLPEVLAKAISKAPALDVSSSSRRTRIWGTCRSMQWRNGVHLEGRHARARYGPVRGWREPEPHYRRGSPPGWSTPVAQACGTSSDWFRRLRARGRPRDARLEGSYNKQHSTRESLLRVPFRPPPATRPRRPRTPRRIDLRQDGDVRQRAVPAEVEIFFTRSALAPKTRLPSWRLVKCAPPS